MDDGLLLARMLANMRAFFRLVGRASSGARTVERDGLTATVVPVVPERSVFNSVIYEDRAALAGALDELAEIYQRAGVRAWTVWVPEGDRASARLLEEAGNHLDARPAAMALTLDGVERPEGLLDWTGEAEIEDLGRVNDDAYDFEGDPWRRALEGLPSGEAHLYVARLDGRPASGLLTLDHEGDCGVYCVAALPAARGRGLTSGLIRHALADAHERGCTTSTLQATKMGRPLYERLGYRSLGAMEMWERRS
jgi:GNAT superfamily N-acetyltransferase